MEEKHGGNGGFFGVYRRVGSIFTSPRKRSVIVTTPAILRFLHVFPPFPPCFRISGFAFSAFFPASLCLCGGFSSIVFARYTIRIMPNQVRTQRLRGEGSMKKLSVVVSLPGQNNYLLEQETAVREAAQRHGVELRLVNANSDAIAQSQQLLEIIQAGSGRPDGILVEPVNNAGLPRVAEAAVAAGIAWVISNARVDYLETLRRNAKVPVFTVTQDHAEIGRIQGRQCGALLPRGGPMLYLRGPATNFLAAQRMEGLESVMPANIHMKAI